MGAVSSCALPFRAARLALSTFGALRYEPCCRACGRETGDKVTGKTLNWVSAVLTIGVMTMCVPDISAVEPELLWPGGAPGAKGDGEADKPAIWVYFPPRAQANGTAVVICPGGGYGGLAMSYEGHDIARWLNRYGIAGIVVRYRVSPYRHPAPFLDATRAVRTVRARAERLAIDPHRIGMLGFSAGGHLVSTVGTHFDAGDPKAKDPVDRASSRPDYLVLIYPVISMGPMGHAGSRANLLGDAPPADLVAFLSSEKQVTAETPPSFLAHSKMDGAVSSENSVLFAEACRAKNVPVEYFELAHGDHGLGCGSGPEWAAWQARCIAWLKARGLAGR